MARIETTVVEFERRLNNVERTQEQIIELNRQNAILIEQMVSVKHDISDIKCSIAELKNDVRDHQLEPAKNWKSLWWAILMLGVGAVAAMVLDRIGLRG